MDMTPTNTPGKDSPAQELRTPNEALRILRGSALFAGFSEAELKALLPALQPALRHYGKDNVIIDEGDEADQIGFVASGRVVARKMTSGGHTHILAVHEAGDNFGFDAAFSSHRTSPLTFTADTDCTALFVSSSCFLDVTTAVGVRLMNNANRILADKCVRLLYKTDVLSKQSLRERILTYFGIMEMKSQGEAFLLRMSREQFAQYLCVNRSALSRELSRMQSDGLIEIRPGGYVLIKSGRDARPLRDEE
ncbi:cAMP-binding domain of CRP or a regulatory subunit of cAMP-dependent protein kinases [Sporobacter termitidis DSM 10068]|uniref:cAMP-binding domain of CRP or a regulatory subunit of cAMP-dependent protein kinases n=1 Tax=Sporobacter termitidis DSM 10068 TaxID=1123282 RepID=A0A1M5XEC7_9FIRM|nr:Crp/Fnr family transcriptional regulator [Sporobacter termitidis]SHH97854.1 cAMP-binding domain of CRP or a regulatory subunit of cAMP-dependent protein kinases [Sporobacter termitidis DSM 10068]